MLLIVIEDYGVCLRLASYRQSTQVHVAHIYLSQLLVYYRLTLLNLLSLGQDKAGGAPVC